jgi:hypothetical protein
MSDTPTFQTEPEAPTIEMWHGRPPPPKADLVGAVPPLNVRQGAQESIDREEWMRDMEYRRNRATEIATKRQQMNEQASKQIDLVAELDAELEKLETAAQAFERDFRAPNEPLIRAKQLVADLEAKLAIAKRELEAIEAKGDSVSRLKTSIQRAESSLLGLHGVATKEIVQSLIDGRLGPGVPFERIPSHLKDEARLNSRVRGLDSLRHVRAVVSSGEISKDALLKALDIAGGKLAELRAYVIADREKHAS